MKLTGKFGIIPPMKAVGSIFFLLTPFLFVQGATSQAFDRYETIVTRQMFGPLPPDFDPEKMPSEVTKTTSAAEKLLTQEQEQIKKSIRFMAINKTAEGAVMVGFADFADPKNPLTYYLKAGESQNGWTVREADPETAVMTIVNKEGVEVTLKLGGDSAKDLGSVSKASASPSSPSVAPASPRGSTLFGSLRDRRRQREAQAAAAAKERAEREAEAEKAEKAEREEQRRQLQDLKEEIQRMNDARAANAAKEAGEKETVETKEEN